MQDDDRHLKLFLAHRAALIDYATPLVGDRSHAEDVVQEAFLRFRPGVRAGESGRPAIEQPVAYLYRIVRNLALDWARRRPLEQRQAEEGQGPHWLRPPAPRTPEQDLLHRRDLERMAEALDGLSDAARVALEMHRFGGYTLEEIAGRLGVSVATAHRLVKQGVLAVTLALGPDA